AAVMTLDAAVDRPQLFGYLLALNAHLCGVAFATDGDRVLLVSERPTLDLDLSEVLDIIARVTTCADEHDDALVARFGGRLGTARRAALLQIAAARAFIEADRGQHVGAQRQLAGLAEQAALRIDQLGIRQ